MSHVGPAGLSFPNKKSDSESPHTANDRRPRKTMNVPAQKLQLDRDNEKQIHANRDTMLCTRPPSLGPSGSLGLLGRHPLWGYKRTVETRCPSENDSLSGAPSHMRPARFNAAFTFAMSSSASNLNASRGRDAALLDNGAPTSRCCSGRRAGRPVDEFARSGLQS